MDHLEELLQELNFTQYEAQAFTTLIKYKMLSAREIHKYSGVPQPKIYETMLRLQKKGFINIIPKGKKKMYMIKPREVIQEYFLNKTRKIEELGTKSVEIINRIYDTEESVDIPFIGIAGEEHIQEYIHMLIDTSKEIVISFLAVHHYDDKIISLLNSRKDEIEIKLIFQDNNLGDLKSRIPGIEIYILDSPAFDTVLKMVSNIEKFLQPEQKNSYGFSIIKDIAINLGNIFGLMVIDWKTSLFKIPIPIKLPMAIMSMLPELVDFHNKGIKEILATSTLI